MFGFQHRRIVMGLSSAAARYLLLLFCSSFLTLSLPAHLSYAQPDKRSASYQDKKRQTNDIAVTIVTSSLSCTCARFAEDIRNVVNDLRPDGVRVLPVLGIGGLQNLNDVLLLKGIDMGVVDEDNLRLLKKRDSKLYANIEQRVQYITKLYNSELHVLARDEIKNYDDLRGKKVNFNLKDSQTEVTADIVFNMLNIDVERSNYDNDEAIKKLRDGEIAAMIILTGAPQAALAKLRREDAVHFLPLDQASLPGHDLRPILDNYMAGEITHEHYPALVAEGTSVPTIANRALLVAYSWPEDSSRYKRLTKFVLLREDLRVSRWRETSQVEGRQPGAGNSRVGTVQACSRLAGASSKRQRGCFRGRQFSHREGGIRAVHRELRRGYRSQDAVGTRAGNSFHQIRAAAQATIVGPLIRPARRASRATGENRSASVVILQIVGNNLSIGLIDWSAEYADHLGDLGIPLRGSQERRIHRHVVEAMASAAVGLDFVEARSLLELYRLLGRRGCRYCDSRHRGNHKCAHDLVPHAATSVTAWTTLW
jgi:uncharacterized protein